MAPFSHCFVGSSRCGTRRVLPYRTGPYLNPRAVLLIRSRGLGGFRPSDRTPPLPRAAAGRVRRRLAPQASMRLGLPCLASPRRCSNRCQPCGLRPTLLATSLGESLLVRGPASSAPVSLRAMGCASLAGLSMGDKWKTDGHDSTEQHGCRVDGHGRRWPADRGRWPARTGGPRAHAGGVPRLRGLAGHREDAREADAQHPAHPPGHVGGGGARPGHAGPAADGFRAGRSGTSWRPRSRRSLPSPWIATCPSGTPR